MALILDKYSRSRFMVVETVDYIDELDMTTNNMDEKNFPTWFYYTITDSDVLRLDTLSYRFYGQTNLWWFIAKLNNITDPFNDLQAGQIIRIPYRKDIDKYYLENKILQR